MSISDPVSAPRGLSLRVYIMGAEGQSLSMHSTFVCVQHIEDFSNGKMKVQSLCVHGDYLTEGLYWI